MFIITLKSIKKFISIKQLKKIKTKKNKLKKLKKKLLTQCRSQLVLNNK